MFNENNRPRLVGSMHRYSDGYGYGARIETDRNIAAEGSIRNPRLPHENTFTNVGKSVPFRLRAGEAERRAIENQKFLSSGGYGMYYHKSRNENPLMTPDISLVSTNRDQESLSPTLGTNISNQPQNLITSRININDKNTAPTSSRNTLEVVSGRTNTNFSTNSVFQQTKLNPLFGKRGSQDLASSMRQPTSRQEKLLNISTTQREFDLSAAWSRGLRAQR